MRDKEPDKGNPAASDDKVGRVREQLAEGTYPEVERLSSPKTLIGVMETILASEKQGDHSSGG